MLYAPKLSTCSEAQEKKETGNEEGQHRGSEGEQKTFAQRLTIGLDLRDRN